MSRDQTMNLAHAFLAALGRRDVHALAALFSPHEPSYADPCRAGASLGLPAVAEHLGLLCQALQGAVVIPIDVLADRDRACIRWGAELPPPRSHALDAVTLLHFVDGAVAEARTFFDASILLPAAAPGGHTPVAEPPPPEPGRPSWMHLQGLDSRGVHFDLRAMRGKVVCLLCAARAVQDHGQLLAQALGENFAGDDRVALVVLLDGTDVPRALLPVARSAMATLRQGAVTQFRDGFNKAGKPVPHGVEDLVWFIPDYDGRLFRAVGVDLPLGSALLLVVAPDGSLAGTWGGPGRDPAVQAARRCRELLSGGP